MIFTQHPNKNGMSYWTHLKHAWTIGFKSIGAGLILFVHGLFPFTFEYTGSIILKGVVSEINRKTLNTYS